MRAKPNLTFRIVKLIFSFTIVCVIFLCSCAAIKDEEINISTTNGTLKFPKQFSQNLKHQEVCEDDQTTEIFSMLTTECEVELYRVTFGKCDSGELMGYLNDIPVMLSIYIYDDVLFPDEETKQLYFSMMESINTVLDSIYATPGFYMDPTQSVAQKSEMEMTYWTVSLPDTMEWEELDKDGTYQAIFYGNVAGERIKLYSIYIGKSDAPTVLGTMTIDGVKKSVAVENYDINSADDWTEADCLQAGYMMDTINDVIQAIMSNSEFSQYEQ